MKDVKNHVRQHYIPQFILRNFAFDGTRVHFFDVKEDCWNIQYVANTFMENYMYSEGCGNGTSLEVENSLTKFETEIASIFKKLNCEQ